MSRTYKATGIILKSTPLGESDRLLGILTPEWGLLRAVANGARKPTSHLRGRCEPLTVSNLLLARGKTLDKVSQLDTEHSYASRDLGKLTAAQYLAEIVLCVALSDQPQPELYALLREHLDRLQRLPDGDRSRLVPHLAHAAFHLLAATGIAPQVHHCCLTRREIAPDRTDPHWSVRFSSVAGGLVAPTETPHPAPQTRSEPARPLNALHVALLQSLPAATLPAPEALVSPRDLAAAWSTVERVIRDHAQAQCGRPIRSAEILDAIA